MAEGAEGDEGHAQPLGGVDEPVGLVDRLEGRILSLDGIYLGNCERSLAYN